VPSILVEKVKYDQANGWPMPADGNGYSLHRLSLAGYGNDLTNWFAALPSPGVVTPQGSPPQITSSPSSQAWPLGSNASFNVAFAGTPPVGSQWRFNGTNLPGALTNPLVLFNLQGSQEGPYDVVLTNGYGAVTSAVAILSVLRPPTIVAPPASVTTTQGFNAAFSVLVDGTSPLRYQWVFNGNSIPAATNNPLRLTTVQTSQAGSYGVIVSNDYGGVTSSVATLIVGVPPSFTQMPSDQLVAVGANVSFTVNENGTPPLLCQWRYNGTNLPGATFLTLILNNVQTNQAGLYNAVSMNGFGSTTSAVARLSIAEPPVLLPFNLMTSSIPYLTFSGASGHVYEVQGTLDFVNWLPVARFTNTSGQQQTVSDPGATNFSRRFYRARVVN
jgi:hypothetical protein